MLILPFIAQKSASGIVYLSGRAFFLRRAELAGKNRKFVKFAFNDIVFSRVVSFQNMAKFTVQFIVISSIISKFVSSRVFWLCPAMLRFFWYMLRFLLRSKFWPPPGSAGQRRGRNSKQKKTPVPCGAGVLLFVPVCGCFYAFFSACWGCWMASQTFAAARRVAVWLVCV